MTRRTSLPGGDASPRRPGLPLAPRPNRPSLPRPGIIWLILALVVGALPSAHAHTPGTSYCKVAIAPEELAITFTFDLAALARITALDTNADDRITHAELLAATPVIEAFLRQSVFLELNEREAAFGPLSDPSWTHDAQSGIPAADWPQRLTALTFRNSLLHAPDAVALTFDFFGTLGERHTVFGNFHFNGQENPVVFTRFEPDYLFDTGYRVPAWHQFRQYFRVGVSHIWAGYDHLAFLLALLFVPRFRELVKIVTAFTVAHTLTLALVALDIVSLPSRFVESAIAASIVYVAAENLWRKPRANLTSPSATTAPPSPAPAHRWRIAFAFGLVHGFGFAAILRELGLPSEGLVRSLLAFNLGVEFGQLLIAALCWPLILWLSRRACAHRARTTLSFILLLFGTAWLLDRALALDLMPF